MKNLHYFLNKNTLNIINLFGSNTNFYMVCSLWSLSFAWFDSENQLNDDTTENHHSNNSATDIVNL